MKKNGFLLLIVLFSCGKKSSTDSENESTISIDTFSEAPAEINGCSCYFSSDSIAFSQNKFIYVNNFTNVSYMSINGKMIKFSLNVSKSKLPNLHVFESEEAEIRIEDNPIAMDAEGASIEKGELIITPAKGKELRVKFYGTCGC
jgi:hypothetical protein